MHLLIATGIFMPEIGGPATYAAKLADELVRLGHQVTVLTYSNTTEYPFDDGLPYQVIRVKRTHKIINYYNYYKKVKALMRTGHYDAIYCFDHFSAGLPTVLANKKYKQKILIRVGGDFIWERYIERSGDLVTLRQFYQRKLHLKSEKTRFKLIKWVFQQVDRIIFTTEFQRDIFLDAYHIALEKTDIIHNPVDSSPETKKSSGRSNKEILFAGRFIQKNNINFLIDAFLGMRDKSFQLVLIGEGPLKKRIAERIKNSGLRRVKLLNKIIGLQLIQRLNMGYLVVFPSLTDISPNTLLECLHKRVPFIATSQIGYNWLNGKAILFDPQKEKTLTAALDVLSIPENYRAYQERLAKLNYTHSYRQAAEQTLKIIAQI